MEFLKFLGWSILSFMLTIGLGIIGIIIIGIMIVLIVTLRDKSKKIGKGFICGVTLGTGLGLIIWLTVLSMGMLAALSNY